MTTRPELKLGSHLVRGVAALALFALMAAVFLTAPFEAGQGFGSDAEITASIGYAMFNLTDLAATQGESFLVAFIIIAVVLDAALDGSLYLAKRERDGESVTALVADGGRELKRTLGVENERDEDDTRTPDGGEDTTPAAFDRGRDDEGGDR